MSGFIQLAHPAFWQVVLLRRDNEGGNNKVRARPAPVMRLFKLPAEVSAFVQVNVRCHGLINEKTLAFRLRPITGLASRFRLPAGVFSACRWAVPAGMAGRLRVAVRAVSASRQRRGLGRGNPARGVYPSIMAGRPVPSAWCQNQGTGRHHVTPGPAGLASRFRLPAGVFYAVPVDHTGRDDSPP